MHNSPIARFLAAVLCVSTLGAPLTAQDEGGVTSQSDDEDEAGSAKGPPRPFGGGLDLSVTVPRDPDALVEEQCERENDVGRVQGEIVVCRQLGEASDGSYDREEFERGYAERTQGDKPVNVSGMRDLAHSITLGSAPEAVLMIDVEALPEAPAGSDADRIARGLPALGQDEDLTPEEIQRRRRAAGLDAPDLPGQ
ncbi:hypothetical protein INR77_00890 [Erythrobacter sp. SCSIO 43205]|uniref:hypothetical protein n=1 Tax=Erythrobacter sp. SCSIO 43205 TaxID=2779361 RepID=UPI001CA8EBF9|nr:hypothetical protein [Erythrobacter sp. SCSIO 43205]UAB78342.1 hypothetical protein INR77_00890 [Erythrobacter sp. SCSIO 43205]